MNFIREIVSGSKNRMKEQGYNLDLTYITPRIVAMSYPGEGIEIAYRNNINEVAQFIQERHDTDYRVYNLCGRPYDYKKFNNQVLDYPWEDHHSPPISLLFRLCKNLDDYLSSKLSNVAFIHCKAGKGRTGTAICCYLLYSGRFQNADEALSYYAKKRFYKGGGVTQPSQIRYVHYFEQLLKQDIAPVAKYISSLTMLGIPNLSNKTCRPFIEIYSVKDNTMEQIYSDKTAKYKQQRKYRDMECPELNQIKLQISTPFVVVGDVMIKVCQNGQYKVEDIFRVAFNSAFIRDNILKTDKSNLDPHKLMKKDNIPNDFGIEILFNDFCKCLPTVILENRCKTCQPFLNDTYKEWHIINDIRHNHPQRSVQDAAILLFGDTDFDDLNEIKYQQYNQQLSIGQGSDDDDDQ